MWPAEASRSPCIGSAQGAPLPPATDRMYVAMDNSRAILDPDMIRLDARKPEIRSVLYRETTDDRTVLVGVQQKLGPAPFNRVVTTLDVLPMEVARRDRTESVVWRKGKG